MVRAKSLHVISYNAVDSNDKGSTQKFMFAGFLNMKIKFFLVSTYHSVRKDSLNVTNPSPSIFFKYNMSCDMKKLAVNSRKIFTLNTGTKKSV